MLTLKLLGRGLAVFVLTLLLLLWHGFPLGIALIVAAVIGAASVLPFVFLAGCAAVLALLAWAAVSAFTGAPTAWDAAWGPGRDVAARIAEGRAPHVQSGESR